MVNIKNFSVGLIVFILWLFIQRHALKASMFTVHAFYNLYAG